MVAGMVAGCVEVVDPRGEPRCAGLPSACPSWPTTPPLGSRRCPHEKPQSSEFPVKPGVLTWRSDVEKAARC